MTTQPEPLVVDREGYSPCPTCRQYSHTLGTNELTAAFMHFQSMFDHRSDGIPTQYTFDAKTRDAAQVLMAAAERIAALEGALEPFAKAADLAHNAHITAFVYVSDLRKARAALLPGGGGAG